MSKKNTKTEKVKKFYNKRTNVFSYGYYNWRQFWKAPKTFFRCIKWAFQRIKYGYCDCDAWDMDAWFCRMMPTMLRNFANTTHGYPDYNLQKFIVDKINSGEIERTPEIDKILEDENGELFEYWQSVLRDMADKFDFYNTDFCDIEEYKKIEDLSEYNKKWREYEESQINSVNEGLDSFKHWFFHLWD